MTLFSWSDPNFLFLLVALVILVFWPLAWVVVVALMRRIK